jgi:hypothetical protein
LRELFVVNDCTGTSLTYEFYPMIFLWDDLFLNPIQEAAVLSRSGHFVEL